ncbi:MAG: FKBP-type peptidyl-prolyl cis-trans isomerase [Longimicrobiales bacterium]|nr:FKBP-type peptidyl-prolyl cis-trans isomerase [Longimicrobiales bacterium]
MTLRGAAAWNRLPLMGSILGVALLAGACTGEGSEEAGQGSFDMNAVEFAPELDVDLDEMERTSTGLYVQVLEEGEDGPEVEPGSTATVHYTGWLPDGTRFDTSRERGEPFVFTVGRGQVIAGWDEGVLGMTPGERRRLVLPPSLGYGSRGAGNGVIPPNSPLVFEVEALNVGGGGG